MSTDVPIGMIMAWPGPQPTIPVGWLLCNGDQISRHQFPALCDVLQDYWGPITGSPDTFHRLPDLRGVFLRGVNLERSDVYADDSAEARDRQKPGASNEVGSFQSDDIRSHQHDAAYIPRNAAGVDWKGGGHNDGDFTMVFGNAVTGATGGKETRPKNTYVHWIIKAFV